MVVGVGHLPHLEWGVAAAPLPGQAESGDVHVVRATDGGVLVAAVDGLGHGAEAAAAARRAAAMLAGAPGDSVISLVRRCHEALRGTRGVVMSLAAFDVRDETMTWLAIGNVDGVLVRAHSGASRPMEAVVMRSGVVGLRLPTLQASVTSILPGDLVVFATDGIERRFRDRMIEGTNPQEVADRLMASYRKPTDDALVLVARYLGRGAGAGAGRRGEAHP
ncbi:MAG TPA: SpoIIE family protein phosphatase [Gemmatimonadales bacterium]|jgi:hypothetical protein|nr:SpoIIE family protein phosphatase [Gemmatimonadales bacterium]